MNVSVPPHPTTNPLCCGLPVPWCPWSSRGWKLGLRWTYHIFHLLSCYIHPASRGVAAHTAGLFRSVRGAKGGVEYEEQSSTGELTYITAGFVNREMSLFPAVTASQAMEFSLLLEALQAAEFQIARQRRLDIPPNPVFFECVSMFLQWFPSKHGTLHFCRHKTGRKHHVRQCFQLGLPKLSNFHFFPP